MAPFWQERSHIARGLGTLGAHPIDPMRIALLSTPFLLLGTVHAQNPTWNLVRNGGFEQVNRTPYTFDQFNLCEGWSNVTIGLSEVFDSTATAKTVGLPKNEYGTVKPSEGLRCAGFFAWKDDLRRNWDGGSDDPFMKGWSAYSEYLMTQLSEPLKEGVTYAYSMDVALAENSDRAVSGLGAYCSPVPLRYEHRRFLEEKAQVATEEILSERGKWVRISGTFEADGGETYLIIGVFPYVGWDSKKIVEGLDNQYAYYFVDNIQLKVAPPEEEGSTK